MRDLTLKPEYSSSHALIIGINNYISSPPLQYATNDAEAIAKILQTAFAFPKDNITLLLNKDATHRNILSSYLRFAREGCDRDSRLLFFFAGHGFTKTGSHREVGFLIPYDGKIDDLSTLVRWEELTLNAELIPAKHILFIMDACYGGLVFNRAMSAGTVRFLKDIYIRPVRQAITAGKEDEPVSDGGPRPGHSVFTGHLIDAMEGAAKTQEGLLTASGIMSYVYEKVSNDIHSTQTPHYGFLSGDGDFIFVDPQLDSILQSDTAEKDQLVTIPSLDIPEADTQDQDSFLTAKQYLSDPKYTIQLHDLVAHHVRRVIVETAKERLPVQGVAFSAAEFSRRLQLCEDSTRSLKRILACIAYWGGKEHTAILSKAFSRITDHLEPESGLVIWNSLRWYPVILLCYASGIAALANENYHNLLAILHAKVAASSTRSKRLELGLAVGYEILNFERANAFKHLPNHEKFYVPRSEYLFKLLQPELDDDLFLGKDYEAMFDRFEVFLALVNATLRKTSDIHAWGPVGRFGYKYSSRIHDDNPLGNIMMKAGELKENWEPFKVGLFGRDFKVFWEAASEYSEEIAKLPWH